MNWNEIFTYDSGRLYWKIKPSKKIAIGSQAGSKNGAGYIEVWWNNIRYTAHVIIWEMHNGPIPVGMEVDHDDHIRDHNDIKNLNLVTHSQNMKNQSKSQRNTSGTTGVTWKKDRMKWHAQIRINGKNKHLGFFDEMEDAIEARNAANRQYGFHINHGS